jgi:hypothetical protein
VPLIERRSWPHLTPYAPIAFGVPPNSTQQVHHHRLSNAQNQELKLPQKIT